VAEGLSSSTSSIIQKIIIILRAADVIKGKERHQLFGKDPNLLVFGRVNLILHITAIYGLSLARGKLP
jgi:hypothetical protein